MGESQEGNEGRKEGEMTHKWGDGFCSCGQDTYMCQSCGRELCAELHPPKWMPELTGIDFAGNVCPTCQDPKERLILAFSDEWRNPGNIPTSDIPQEKGGVNVPSS